MFFRVTVAYRHSPCPSQIKGYEDQFNRFREHLNLTGVESADTVMGGSAGPSDMQQVLERIDKQDEEIKKLASSPARSPVGSVDGASTPGGAWALTNVTTQRCLPTKEHVAYGESASHKNGINIK